MRLHGFKELDRRERAEGSDQHHCVPGLKLMEEGYQGPTGFDPLQAQCQLCVRKPCGLAQLAIGPAFLST
jgi:hypothetical protein